MRDGTLFALGVAAAKYSIDARGKVDVRATAAVSTFWAPSKAEAEAVGREFRYELLKKHEYVGHFSIVSAIPEARLREWAHQQGYLKPGEAVPREEYERLQRERDVLAEQVRRLRTKRGVRDWSEEHDDGD